MNKEVEELISYAIGEGYIDDSAADWTDEEKMAYYERCLAYEAEDN